MNRKTLDLLMGAGQLYQEGRRGDAYDLLLEVVSRIAKEAEWTAGEVCGVVSSVEHQAEKKAKRPFSTPDLHPGQHGMTSLPCRCGHALGNHRKFPEALLRGYGCESCPCACFVVPPEVSSCKTCGGRAVVSCVSNPETCPHGSGPDCVHGTHRPCPGCGGRLLLRGALIPL